jgi:hypothetical protein
MWLKLDKNFRRSLEDLMSYVLLTAVGNILYFNNSAKGAHSCVFMATVNNFILLTPTCRSSIERRHVVAF